MSDWRIIHADVLDGLRGLPDASVHCVVTSPPYFGLRSYGVEGQLGLEATHAEYLGRMVAVFAEVSRVLRPDGTCWVNMGDSYAGSGKGRNGDGSHSEGHDKQHTNRGTIEGLLNKSVDIDGLKPKDLMMMPARLALALQDAGWWLRSDIIWCKRAPMPESVTDRPTSAHEHIFLLSKAERYFYDAEAVRSASLPASIRRAENKKNGAIGEGKRSDGMAYSSAFDDYHLNPAGRNLWNYWLLSPEPYAEAHFATFPTEIPRRAILAGTSEMGVCSECGAPWRRMVERTFIRQQDVSAARGVRGALDQKPMDVSNHWDGVPRGSIHANTTDWQPTCRHTDVSTVPATVLDPFSGAGTTLLVAQRLGRRSIGIELNAEYCEMAHKRIQSDPAAMNMRMELVEDCG